MVVKLTDSVGHWILESGVIIEDKKFFFTLKDFFHLWETFNHYMIKYMFKS